MTLFWISDIGRTFSWTFKTKMARKWWPQPVSLVYVHFTYVQHCSASVSSSAAKSSTLQCSSVAKCWLFCSTETDTASVSTTLALPLPSRQHPQPPRRGATAPLRPQLRATRGIFAAAHLLAVAWRTSAWNSRRFDFGINNCEYNTQGVGLLAYITALLLVFKIYLKIYLCKISHTRTPHP